LLGLKTGRSHYGSCVYQEPKVNPYVEYANSYCERSTLEQWRSQIQQDDDHDHLEGIEVRHGFARYNTELEQKQTLQVTELDVSQYRGGPYDNDTNLNQPLMIANNLTKQKTYA